jgi:hypothetical protein
MIYSGIAKNRWEVSSIACRAQKFPVISDLTGAILIPSEKSEF